MSPAESPRADGAEVNFGESLEAARAGSPDALGQLLGPMRDDLKREAARGMGQILQQREDASDIVNTTYVNAVEGFQDFSGDQPDQLRAWIRAILNNTLARMGRRYGAKKRDPRREDPVGSSIDRIDCLDRQPSPSSMLSRKEWRAEVRRAMLQLSDNHQRVLRLRYESELDFRQVAKQLDISVDAAKHLWSRAVKELASELRRGTFRRNIDPPRPSAQNPSGS